LLVNLISCIFHFLPEFMRKRLCLILAICTFCTALTKKSDAQAASADSSSKQNAFNNAVILYNTSLGNQSPIYNGPEYYYYDPTVKGNAYFMDINAFTAGAIYYDGIYYTGIPMLYDLYSDEVAVLLYNHFSKFSLRKDKITSFDFLGHHFINIDADTTKGVSGIKSGFYDELYNGKSEVLVRRSKSIQTNTGGTLGAERYFSPSRDLYFKKNNVFYSISGQGSLIKVLKDKKNEIQQYIKANQIRFRSDPEEAMVTIAKYYDHITN